MNIDDLVLFRRKRLREIIHYANKEIPFYRNFWKDAGVNSLRIQSFKELQELPVVSKADLRQAQKKDLFGLSKRNDYKMTHTSGTTGPCLYLPFTRQDMQFKYASYLREFYTTGWRLGIPSAALHYSGHPEFGGRYSDRPDRDNFILIRKFVFRIAHRRILLEPWSSGCYKGNEDLPGKWYNILRRHRPYLLESMDFNLLVLYRYIQTHNLPPLNIPVMFVLATLAPELKKRLEVFFSTRIFNRYGPHEIEGIAYECDRHEGMHVAADCVHVEILDEENRPVPLNTSGHLVITDFDSRLMPLIRYKIGDIGRKLDRKCSCGSTFPLIFDIEGRACDRFCCSGGEVIPATEISTSLQALPELDLFQVIQDAENRVEFRLSPADAVRQTVLKPLVEKTIKKVLGERIGLRITAKKPLQLEQNGKFCFAKRVL